nr:hypothetical protein [Candidatus Sigynarchaeota archaeon]
RTTTAKLYGKPRKILLYLNEGIMKKKKDAFQEKLRLAKGEVRDVLHQEGSTKEKKTKTESVLRKHGLQSCFVIKEKKGIVTCTSVKEKVAERANALGKNALFTNDFSLDAADMMRIYKTTGVVEQEFHLLKSELGMGPVFHRRPDRIAVHFALILWGMMALALLKVLLSMRGIEYTFEQLQAKIKEGHVLVGDFIYLDAKSFRIQKSLNINKDLQEIFRVLKIKWEYFDIEVLTTKNEDPGQQITTT